MEKGQADTLQVLSIFQQETSTIALIIWFKEHLTNKIKCRVDIFYTDNLNYV